MQRGLKGKRQKGSRISVETVAAEQAPVTDGTALTPELTGMMFDPYNIHSQQFWAH
jgi:hypothetical protein